MFEKELEQKIQKTQKEQLRKEKQRRRKKPCYKGYYFKNWLVYPLGVISVELDLAQAKKYNALEWSDTKAEEIINKYFIEICDYDQEKQELSFSTEWYKPWQAYASKKDELWCKKFNFELTRYVENIYEIDGFVKTIEDDWIVFTKK